MTDDQLTKYWPLIVDTMSEGLVLIRPDGVIRMVNQALLNMTGYEKEDLVGRSCQVFNCDACTRVRTPASRNWCLLFDRAHNKMESTRCDIQCKDGSWLPIWKKAAVLRDENGIVLGSVETLTDLSQLTAQERKIRELSRQINRNKKGFQGMVGESAAMRRVFNLVEKAAASSAPVLIQGESGTGKDLVAHSIHALSDNQKGPFVQVNCAALSESLFESEIFGHVKGAFTGAYRHRPGRFEAAHGGSIFLDELGDMPLTTQVKLLRVLETKTVERVGDHHGILVDVRIIAATNRDLAALVAENRFREDLFFRINVIPIHLPPLRDRLEDIPLLAGAIMEDLAGSTQKNITGISPEVLRCFMSYSWPGNVRELKSALEFAFVVAESGQITMEHLPNQLVNIKDGLPRKRAGLKPNPEKEALIEALRQAQGNKSQAARILGVSRATVFNRMRKYDVSLEKVIN
ncbi:sigma-54 interaction domain-containing protein [Dethiosulfatarculus sandiegensis]|uniref:Fis family transcriptional regulator n=1 Tax=Dethiosulfatarculus sandiegensis TaxID=1429043 RepID=A0A0D2GCA9_9BACT|nr:sigma-54-dependent Fis family transcriptional regulator [Dethiosulfatarculus sandiegensis]KIX12502.1 Fis family transcriptional regulator [Dethiosulfatarculus sandiegensis]